MYSPQTSIDSTGSAPATNGSGNTSGMGAASLVPPELRGWNWGAFLLNLIWGIGNNTWIALLMLVPVVNWVMPFVLGFKGNAWAWQNKRWRDVAHFRRVQRRWAIAGLLLLVVWAVMIAAAGLMPLMIYRAAVNNPVQDLALTAVQKSPEAVTLLGSPIKRVEGAERGLIRDPEDGLYLVSFVVAGPHGSALVEARARRTNHGMELEHVAVRPSGGGPPLVVLPRQRL